MFNIFRSYLIDHRTWQIQIMFKLHGNNINQANYIARKDWLIDCTSFSRQKAILSRRAIL